MAVGGYIAAVMRCGRGRVHCSRVSGGRVHCSCDEVGVAVGGYIAAV